MKLKDTIYQLVEKGSYGKKINLTFDYIIICLIILSLISIVLESIKNLNPDILIVLKGFDILSIVIFSIEYIMRLYVSDLTHPSKSKLKSLIKFMFSTYGLIDLLAILPFYLPMLIKTDLRFLRTLRIARFLRILKLNRYTKSLNLIWVVLKEKKTELAVTGFMTFLLLIIASFLIYNIEGEIQPDAFPNLIESFWWAIATVSTAGYGNIYPITGLGKLIGGVISLLGIIVVALPTGIIGSGFMKKIKNDKKSDKKNCPHCGKKI